MRLFLQSFRKNAKIPIYGLLAAKAACRVKNRLKAILGIILHEAQQPASKAMFTFFLFFHNIRLEEPQNNPAESVEPPLLERRQNLAACTAAVNCGLDSLSPRELAVAEMLLQGFKYRIFAKD
ncbi:MAG: hypothetical protein LBD47_08955 [Treponema sp.]|nr:hypothetical protein [Treponema sp.]